MTIIPITLPPGLFMNSTPYGQKNRYNGGSLVRWRDGSLRPVGGWAFKANPATGDDLSALSPPGTGTAEIYHDAFTWVSNNNSRFYVFGSNRKLQVLTQSGDIIDITPAGFVGSPGVPTFKDGYGDWFYGLGLYGTSRPTNDDDVALVHRWSFDTWGEDLIIGPASPFYRGQLYYYDVTNPTEPAVVIPNSPVCNGMVVTDERIIMTIGSPLEGRLVRWSDRENYNEWEPDINNYAGEFFIQGTGRLISINKVLSTNLILSENDAHVARFIGAPLVYGFDRIGSNCGPWNAACVKAVAGFAMWPSRESFWMFDGALRQVPCSVQDFLNEDVDFAYTAAAGYSVHIPEYNEIWWFYRKKAPSSDNYDLTSYVAYDYVEKHWQIGSLARSAAVDGESYVRPVMVNRFGRIFDHELPTVPVPASFSVYATTGPLELGNGENNMAVRYIYPDTQSVGDVTYTLIGSQMPTEPAYEYGPYPYNNPIPTRAMGRQISLRIDALPATIWEVGPTTRFDVAPMGTGRR